MFKRIYLSIFAGSLIFAAHNSFDMKNSNIKKIIKENNKIIVILRENGKDKKVVLDAKTLEKLDSSKKESRKSKISKKNSKNKIVAKKSKATTEKKSVSSDTKLKKGEYKVVAGDTIFSIAKKYKVSIEDLVKLNKLDSSTLIHPGDILKIPGKSFTQEAKEAVAKNKKTVYKVKRGDTLYSIAKKYNMKIDTLRKLNNLKQHPKLKPGMELTVIGKPIIIKKRKKPTKYVVKAGDTLWSISKRFNLTIYQLRLLNPKIRIRGLRRGAVLNISKEKAVKIEKRLAKLKKRRKKRLSGMLAKYKRSYSYSSGNKVVRYAKRWLGSRYVWGASRPGAFDCSGFTQFVMKHAKGRIIPRVSRRQAYYGMYVSRRNLRAGDLIFFDTSRRRRGYVNHVGIYIGNNLFIHASSAKHRVVITSLNKPFYRQRFMWGRRIN